jgi:hypothetical protein
MNVRHRNETKNACILVNPPHGAAEKTVAIYGVQRGGTSMVAAVVEALGIDLAGQGLNHEDPRFQTAAGEDLDALIAARNAEAPVWGFMAPQTTLKLDYLETRLRNPHYVCVFRNPAAVADSVMMRRGGPAGDQLRRTLRFYDKMTELIARTRDPLLVVNYERASADPKALVEAVAEFLEIALDDDLRGRALAMVTGDGGGYRTLRDGLRHG